MGVAVGVAEGVGLGGVEVGAGVIPGVKVGVGVGVIPGVKVGVGVDVIPGVKVGVAVGVGVGAGDPVGPYRTDSVTFSEPLLMPLR
jgi:hypothetical protein